MISSPSKSQGSSCPPSSPSDRYRIGFGYGRRSGAWRLTPAGCRPCRSAPTPQKRQQIEKAFFDTLLNATVEEVLAMEHPERTSPWQDLALTLNEGNAAHAHEIDTFEDLLAAEARGGAEASAPMIATAVEQLRLELGLPPRVLRTTAPE